MKLLNIFFIPVIIASIVFSPVALASGEADKETIVTLKKGEIAPFAGTLFSTPAATKLLVDLELTREKCDIEVKRAVDIKSAQMQLQIDNISASLDTCNSKYKTIIELKDQQIDFLDDRLMKAAKPKTELWFAAGVVGGILLSLTAAWSYGQISNVN
tara:strand:- start:5898 stop:6368 length:471 start_codon:yes stop_codon:yes gene_type:complete